MGAPQKQGGGLPDPLNVHKPKDRGGMGLPDPLNLFDSAPTPMAPPPVPPAAPLAPTMADATARLDAQRRSARDSGDAQRRKRGRRSTIYTSDEGVGDAPLGRKTLVGS